MEKQDEKSTFICLLFYILALKILQEKCIPICSDNESITCFHGSQPIMISKRL